MEIAFAEALKEAGSRLKEKELEVGGPLKQNRREVWLIKDHLRQNARDRFGMVTTEWRKMEKDTVGSVGLSQQGTWQLKRSISYQ